MTHLLLHDHLNIYQVPESRLERLFPKTLEVIGLSCSHYYVVVCKKCDLMIVRHETGRYSTFTSVRDSTFKRYQTLDIDSIPTVRFYISELELIEILVDLSDGYSFWKSLLNIYRVRNA